MDREKIFKTFFKYNDNGEQKFCNFNQLTAIGKRITFIVLNKALGASKVKTTVNWLREKKIISNSKSDQRTVQSIIHHWNISGGETSYKVFEICTS